MTLIWRLIWFVPWMISGGIWWGITLLMFGPRGYRTYRDAWNAEHAVVQRSIHRWRTDQ